MFGLGMQELILILVVALVIIGPKKLPDIARALGRAMREFRRATDDLKQNFDMDTIELTQRPVKKAVQPTPAVTKPKENTSAQSSTESASEETADDQKKDTDTVS